MKTVNEILQEIDRQIKERSVMAEGDFVASMINCVLRDIKQFILSGNIK